MWLENLTDDLRDDIGLPVRKKFTKRFGCRGRDEIDPAPTPDPCHPTKDPSRLKDPTKDHPKVKDTMVKRKMISAVVDSKVVDSEVLEEALNHDTPRTNQGKLLTFTLPLGPFLDV